MTSTNAVVSHLLNTNITSTNAIITNIASTNQTNTNLLNTNITSTNAIITNVASTNETNSNLLNTNMTSTNAIITNAAVTNETASNIVNTAFTSGGAVITNLVNTAFTSGGAIITDLVSTNITSATLHASSVVNFTSTVDAVNATNGGTLTVLGGASISKQLYVNTVNVTPSLGDISQEKSFTCANGILSPANITGFAFSNDIVRSFNAIVSVDVVKSVGTSLFSNYEIKGLQSTTGAWIINSSYIGDNTGHIFSIDGNGQLLYTSVSQGGFASSTIKFRALTTSL